MTMLSDDLKAARGLMRVNFWTKVTVHQSAPDVFVWSERARFWPSHEKFFVISLPAIAAAEHQEQGK